LISVRILRRDWFREDVMRLFTIGLVAFLLCSNAGLSAQDSAPGPLRFGIGASVGHLSASVPQHDDPFVGASLHLIGGAAVSPHVQLGLELDAFLFGFEGALTSLALVGSYYPTADGNLYFKVGVASRYLFFSCAEHNVADVAPLVGFGLHLRRGKSFPFTPFVQLATSVAELASTGGAQGGTLVQLGVRLSL
jgi:hypothetical protein